MKSFKEYISEALKNPYADLPKTDIKRKLNSFKEQLADLENKKSKSLMGGSGKGSYDKEIDDFKTKIKYLQAALK